MNRLTAWGERGLLRYVVGRARCLVGKHERSVGQARAIENSEQFESVCRYCGVPMVRLAKRNWVVKPRE